jgi:alanine racemase
MAAKDIRASVDSLAAARRLSDQARRIGATLGMHIKFDTGMGRLGLLADAISPLNGATAEISRAVESVLAIGRLPGLKVEGLYTHFANADARDKSHARMQFDLFMAILDDLQGHGFQVPLRHAANSAATIEMPETHLDMVRPGIAQYGLPPSDDVDLEGIRIRPVMTLTSTVIKVKEVPAGFKISYGSTYETPAPTRIATVPVGYADGYPRLLSSRGVMLVHGVRAPVVGRVCMDLTMIDVGHVPRVAVGDEVVVFGRQGDEQVSVDELAGQVRTINYEIVTSLTSRVRRVYQP